MYQGPSLVMTIDVFEPFELVIHTLILVGWIWTGAGLTVTVGA